MTDLIKNERKELYEELSSWLNGTTIFNITQTFPETSWPPVILVKELNGSALEIALISLSEWRDNPGLSELLLEFHKNQAQSRQEGLTSITLWEDVWITKKEIVKSRIASLLKVSKTIPARLGTVRRIDKAVCRAFLNENHIQGNTSSKFRYGLFLPEKYFRVLPEDFEKPAASVPEILVAVATFSAPRIFSREGQPHRSYELIRFANLKNLTVVGGFDKLIKHFVKEIAPDDIMTYSDSDWSDGKSYAALGFEYVSEKEPFSMVLDMNTLSRKISAEDVANENVIKVFNAGSRKFVKTIARENKN